MEEMVQKLGLSFLKGLGPIRVKNLLSKLDGLDELYSCSLLHLRKKTGLSELILSQLDRKGALETAKRELEFCVKAGVIPLFIEDDAYPRRLKQCPDSPLFLFQKGNADLNNRRIVSIVGTRNFTPYGKSLVFDFIQGLSSSGITIVSGLAIGIDALAHKNALDNNLPTIAVLGHGLSTIFPKKNEGLAKAILEQNGSIISEFPFNSLPVKEHFALRNRIIAGLSDAVVVVESKARGGSLITANFANDYNREVFAFPGSVKQECSAGCNGLIRDHKAHLMTDVNDFLTMMNWQVHFKKQQSTIDFNPSDTEQLILQVLKRHESVFLDELVQITKLTASALHVNLLGLQLKNVIMAINGNRYAMK